jgi:hypothetical protein
MLVRHKLTYTNIHKSNPKFRGWPNICRLRFRLAYVCVVHKGAKPSGHLVPITVSVHPGLPGLQKQPKSLLHGYVGHRLENVPLILEK